MHTDPHREEPQTARKVALQLGLIACAALACYLALNFLIPLSPEYWRYPSARLTGDLALWNTIASWPLPVPRDAFSTIAAAVGLCLVLVGCYALALRVVSKVATSRLVARLIVGWGALFALTSVFSLPNRNIDVYLYMFYARVFNVYHANPFTAWPAAFPGDPYLHYVPAPWLYTSSLYGPIWTLLCIITGWLGGGNIVRDLLAVRGLLFLLNMANIALIWRIMGRFKPAYKLAGVLFYAWNPVVVLQGQGHVEPLILCFLLLSVSLYESHRRWPGLASIGLSAVTKLVTAPLLVVYFFAIFPPKYRRYLPGAALVVGALTLLLLPANLYTPRRLVFLPIFLGAVAWGCARQLSNDEGEERGESRLGRLLGAWTLALFVFCFVLAPTQYAWYLITLVGVACLMASHRLSALTVALSLSGLLSWMLPEVASRHGEPSAWLLRAIWWVPVCAAAAWLYRADIRRLLAPLLSPPQGAAGAHLSRARAMLRWPGHVTPAHHEHAHYIYNPQSGLSQQGDAVHGFGGNGHLPGAYATAEPKERTAPLVWLLRVMVGMGLASLAFYFSWWWKGALIRSPYLIIALVLAALYNWVQLVGNWVLYLAARRRPAPPPSPSRLSVDVYVTCCRESHDLIYRALSSACSMRGKHRTYLLDDGGEPALRDMAARLGAGYLTRSDHKHAKAGNLNAALPRTGGDIIVIFDIDHAPTPDFLERTLGYFTDPRVGFVQVMLTFCNAPESWVARAAGESTLDYYNPTSVGMDGIGSTTLVGSNALIRRSALEGIGGYQPGLAEDLATSIALHGAGWRSVYVAEPLAPGLAPPDVPAWFTQQLKWARGVFELLLTAYPRFFPRLTWGQRLSYAVRMTYYWVGPVVSVHLLFLLALLFGGSQIARVGWEQYLIHVTPLVILTALIRQVALLAWRHPSTPLSMLWRAMCLVYATWPVYMLAWVMALVRLPLAFRPTPKSSGGRLNPVWLVPQVISLLLLACGVLYTLVWSLDAVEFVPVVFAVVQSFPMGIFLWHSGRDRLGESDWAIEPAPLHSLAEAPATARVSSSARDR